MFAIVGVVAGLTHVYAALFRCCLSAGLVVLSYTDSRRRNLLRPALALGLSAGITILVFIVWAMKFVNQASWMELSYQSILTAYWYLRRLTLGSRLGTIFFIVLFAKALSLRSTRPFATAFGSAWALFVVIPLLASLAQPIIVGRYWLIGAPSLIVFIVFLMSEFLRLGGQARRVRLYWGGCLAGLLLLVLTDAGGYFQARILVSEKPIWRGAQIASPLLRNCPMGSVHVNEFVSLFAVAAHVPEDLFVATNSSNAGLLSQNAFACPVLGWAEHLQDAAVGKEDEELLYMLKISASPSAVDIRRHKSGVVVMKLSSQF
jgi:hypothetical protein